MYAAAWDNSERAIGRHKRKLASRWISHKLIEVVGVATRVRYLLQFSPEGTVEWEQIFVGLEQMLAWLRRYFDVNIDLSET